MLPIRIDRSRTPTDCRHSCAGLTVSLTKMQPGSQTSGFALRPTSRWGPVPRDWLLNSGQRPQQSFVKHRADATVCIP